MSGPNDRPREREVWKKAVSLFLCLAVFVGSGCSRRSVSLAAETAAPAEEQEESASAENTAAPAETRCPHSTWTDGVCDECGAVCTHAWSAGVCGTCGMVCRHERHDPLTRQCPVCGMAVRHHYVGNTCADCGAAYSFETAAIPAELTGSCPEQGALETLTYTAPDYLRIAVGEEAHDWERRLVVYLPYGYDPAEKYDLLILMHGDGCDENYWLAEEHEFGKDSGQEILLRDVLDNMIHERLCSRMIVACPSFFSYEENGDKRRINTSLAGVGYEEELKETLLPLLAERYSTYIDPEDPDGLTAARDHIGYIGFSRGSIIGYSSILAECTDAVAWIGCLSCIASSEDYHTAYYIHSELAQERFSGCPVRLLYSGGGSQDPAWWEQKANVEVLEDIDDKLTGKVNSFSVETEDAGHEFKSWAVGFYNCLQLFFGLTEG